MPGNTVGIDPLANIILSATTVSTVPSALVTSIVFLSTNLPNPSIFLTPLLSNKNWIPATNSSVTFCFLAIIASKSGLTSPSTTTPKSLASFTVLKTSAEANKAFVGIQPTFKQVPPNLFFSITVTSAPSIAAFKAATYPPGPPPITATFICYFPHLPCMFYSFIIYY